jgi:hypothetical protein
MMAGLPAEPGLRSSLAQAVEPFIGRSLPQCLDFIERRLGHAPPQDFGARRAQLP